MDWRLGLDVGTNSIGWWAFELEPPEDKDLKSWRVAASLDGGVRIFSDGREPSRSGRVGDGLAVERRLARGMRRNRDHGKIRMAALVKDLIGLGLLPAGEAERRKVFETSRDDPEANNPYRLRAEALERELTPNELGRALFHLGRRRGYKSNRKEASDEDGGKLKERIDAMRGRLGNLTLGQFLWAAYRKAGETEAGGADRPGLRFRGESEFYPDRAMYAAEFDAIRARQKDRHALSDDDWGRLRDKWILDQRPLRLVERGRCEFFPSQPRHWKDTPIAHDFRIYQELNALRWIDSAQIAHSLDREQREAVLDLLMTRKSEVKFSSMRKVKRSDKSPLFDKDSTFNLEDAKRKGLKPHKFAAAFSADPNLDALWKNHRGDGVLDDLFEVLHSADVDEHAMELLADGFDLETGACTALIKLPLASGTMAVSRKFMEQIVPVLRDQGLMYWDAVAELTDEDGNRLHHSLREDGSRWDRLPYYGEVMAHSMLGADPGVDAENYPEKHFGRINNPTVHVALNQLRQLVNVLTDRFEGPPREIHIELTRDLKLSRQRRDEISRDQARNQKENKRIAEEICTPLGIADPSARDIKKVRLWEELGSESIARLCVFSGQPISAADLFNGEAEIEHILPFSRTLDDSMANLTVAKRWANRLKGNNTPYEAFAAGQCESQEIFWRKILERAGELPENKRWRFSPDALDRYDRDGGFIARQLTDTAYMSRAATRYLKALEGVEQIVSSPGRLTALIRGKWRFNGILADDNRKNRDDHRHHAIDAAVIGLTDRAVLNAVSRMTARGADDRVRLEVPDLDPGIGEAIRDRVRAILVSYKSDHGPQGRMYNETAYGLVGPAARDPDLPDHNLVTRKELASLTEKECEAIRDRRIRESVRDWLYEAKGAGLKHDKALAEYVREHGVKRVRILVKNQTVRAVPSAPYKGYAPESYVCCDVWRVPKGKPGKWSKDAFEWTGVFWPYAETGGGVPDKAMKKPHPAAKFVARLFKDDVIGYLESGRISYARIAGFSTTNNKLDVRSLNLTDTPQTYVSINVLGRNGMKRVRFTPDGRLRE